MFGTNKDEMGKYSEIPIYSDSSDEDSDLDDDFVQNYQRQQQEHMKRQDEGLEMLEQGAQRLNQLSLGISEELHQQNRMLDDMETDLDRAATRLDTVTAKTKELVKRAGGTKYFLIIVALTLILLVLLFLVIYA